MFKITFSAFAVSLLALGLIPNFAQAQSRVFVAAQGSDANPCTFAAPCRTFQHAHDTVAAGGEIDVLDPAGYGTLTINKAISIQGHGFAGLAAPSGDGITIGAGAGDKISLRGLLLEGVGGGSNGITFNTGGSLDVQDCVIRNFSAIALEFQPTATSALYVSNTHIADNGGGIYVIGSGDSSGVIDRVVIENHRFYGVSFAGTAAEAFTVSDSVITGGNLSGVHVNPAVSSTVMVRDVLVSNNSLQGVVATGAPAVVRITRSTITGNGTGLVPQTGGQIISFGDNSLAGNGTDGAPSSTILLK